VAAGDRGGVGGGDGGAEEDWGVGALASEMAATELMPGLDGAHGKGGAHDRG